MRFYDILQWDPQITKGLIRKSTVKKEKMKLWAGIFLRSVLIVLFAVIFISLMTSLFGSENSPMAVAVFCILLGVRFVDFGYCIKDELTALGVVFMILLLSPTVVSSVPPLPGFFINALSFLMILFITCDRPEMGNGGLFSFAYIYLSGNPVYEESLLKRFFLAAAGLLICAVIFYIKHREKNINVRFADKVKAFTVTEFKYQWMIRMAVGVSAVLSLGIALNIERFMWAGFACGSLLSEYSPNPGIKEKSFQRFTGAVAGSVLFWLIYRLLPAGLHSIIGPLGGFSLGFCVDYKFKTAVNCLGALMIASQLYGPENSVLLRITDTVIGIIFALVFYFVYEKYIAVRFNSINRVENI